MHIEVSTEKMKRLKEEFEKIEARLIMELKAMTEIEEDIKKIRGEEKRKIIKQLVIQKENLYLLLDKVRILGQILEKTVVQYEKCEEIIQDFEEEGDYQEKINLELYHLDKMQDALEQYDIKIC